MDGMTVIDRLEVYAKEGYVSCSLNLYKRQIEKLVMRDGLAVQCGTPVPGWKGQFRCRIGWRYALPQTTAWHLLEMAAENNPQLKEELQKSSEDNPLEPPYSSNCWEL